VALTTPDGKQRIFHGKQSAAGDPETSLTIHDWSVFQNLIRKGDIGFAEAYRNGHWETNDLTALMHLALLNKSALDRFIIGNKLFRFVSMVSYLLRLNTLTGSRRNIHAHYDLGNAFYQVWLDPSMTYSAALYKTPGESLESAQTNKYDRILEQMDSNSGRVLEIGCGWGGFANRALTKGDYDLKGITLSSEQHAHATKKLGNRAAIALEDYRHQTGKFDHIVSIEMFEAVGQRYWKTYFEKLGELLKQKGKAVIQTITINEQDFPRYRKGGDFIRSHIFPGGMLPSASRFQAGAEKAGLKTGTPFFFGHHYADTLEAWLNTFDNRRVQILALGFDEPFIRLWRLYLAACMAGFRTGTTDVMQVEVTHV